MKLRKKKTIDDLLAIKDEEKRLKEIYKYLDKATHYGDKLDLNDFEKTLYLILDFENQMIEGGLSLYFTTSSGNYCQETVEAFNTIGLSSIADLLSQAIALFPDSLQIEDLSARRSLLDMLFEDNPGLFDSLDDELNKMDVDIHQSLNDYINKKDIHD